MIVRIKGGGGVWSMRGFVLMNGEGGSRDWCMGGDVG